MSYVFLLRNQCKAIAVNNVFHYILIVRICMWFVRIIILLLWLSTQFSFCCWDKQFVIYKHSLPLQRACQQLADGESDVSSWSETSLQKIRTSDESEDKINKKYWNIKHFIIVYLDSRDTYCIFKMQYTIYIFISHKIPFIS